MRVYIVNLIVLVYPEIDAMDAGYKNTVGSCI